MKSDQRADGNMEKSISRPFTAAEMADRGEVKKGYCRSGSLGRDHGTHLDVIDVDADFYVKSFFLFLGDFHIPITP
jgi:hypothetical protein